MGADGIEPPTAGAQYASTASAVADGRRNQRRPYRHPELLMPQRTDPASRLHRVLDRCRAVAEERGSCVDVRYNVSHPPERGRTLPGRSGRTDDLDDHFPEPEEDLADRSPAEFAVPLSARVHTDSGQRL